VLTVLLTDGAFTGLIRTLREAYPNDVRIVGLSTDPHTPHQAILDAFYVVSEHDCPGYMNDLLTILKKDHVDIIFPIVSEGIEDLLDHESQIFAETGAKILSSPLSAVKTANDKGLLYSFLRDSKDSALAALSPLFFLADTKQELFEGIDMIKSEGKKPCIKRRRGEDAAGFWVIDDSVDYASMLFFQGPERTLSETMLMQMLSGISMEASIPPYMVSEFLPGDEWDCDVLCMDGKVLSITTRINLCMTGGLTSVLEVRDNSFLASCCEKIVSALNLSYVVCISFRADVQGRFFLLEINPRMMGNIYVSALAGNNYVKMAVDLMQGRSVSAVAPRTGIKTSLIYDQLLISPNK